MRTIWCAAMSVCLGSMAALAGPPTVMPLGDSITYGRGDGVDIPGGYRGPLYSLVFSAGDLIDFVGSGTGNPSATLTAAKETQHNGYRSATLAELDGNLAGSVPIADGVINNEGGFWLTGSASRPPVYPGAVLLLAGINDVAGSSNVPTTTALARLDTLIGDIFTLRPDAAVFISNLTPVTGAPLANYGTKVAEYNAAVPGIVSTYAALGRKAYFVDMHSALSDTSVSITADGIHPTQAGYQQMAATWYASMAANEVVVPNSQPVWTGLTNAAWSGTGNWSGGAVPTSISDATFVSNVNTFLNVSGTVNKLVFTATATISGSVASVNSPATLQINNGLEHTANSGASYMRIANIMLGNDQDWTLNGPIGTGSTSGVGFTLTPPNSTAPNTINLNGKTLTKKGSGQVSIGGSTITSGDIVIQEGSIRLSVGAGVPLTVGGSGAITVKPNAALMLGGNSITNSTLDVTKTVIMDGGDAANPALLQVMGTQPHAQTIKAPMEWRGASTYGHIVTSNTSGNTWTFSGNWSGTGTINLTTINSGSTRTTTLSGTNSGLTGLIDNQQSAANSAIVFGNAGAGSGNAEWRLSHANAVYRLNGSSVSLGALSGTAGTLTNSSTAAATVTLGGKNVDSTFGGGIVDGGSGPLGLVKTGSGGQTLTGTSTYTGSTLVGGGRLIVNGVLSGSGAVTVAAGAALGGSGTIGGATTLQAGATLTPGSSPGTLSLTSGMTWNGGGNYDWQMLSATGAAGAGDSWDLVSIGGGLTIASTSADPFKINLWTLSGTVPDVSGTAANFDPAQGYTWTIASAAGGISGFAADKFVITTSATNGTGGFANGFGTGTFSMAQSGNDLNLVFTAGAPAVITINVPSGTQTQSQAGYPTLSGPIPMVKTGGGTLVLDQTNTLSGSTTVQGGVLQLANGSALAASELVVVAGGTGQVAPFTTTSVAGLALTGNGLVDLTSGALTIAGGMTGPQLVAEILEARADGSWSGSSGITSSVAAELVSASIPRAVGWIDNGDGSLTAAFAAPGDTNLDWSIDIADLANFLTSGKFGTGLPATWIEGDFSYDGIVDVLDAADFFATGLYNAGNYNTAPAGGGAVAAVPEPTGCGLVGIGLVALVSARFRRRGADPIGRA